MKRAAIGVRMHSGWGALVCVAGEPKALEVIDSRRIVVIEPGGPRAGQPFHYAATLSFSEAERYLDKCALVSRRLAVNALREAVEEVKARRYRVAGVAVLLASGRALPPLREILSAHPLIHTAEGEFFRKAIGDACADLKISVLGVRERELQERANAVFGTSLATHLQKRISSLGKSLGPPWTQDQKTAALAASMLLSARDGQPN